MVKMQEQIKDTVIQFVRSYLSARPGAVIVDLHDSHVLITLRQVICPAEREYARERRSRELLERLFSETFDVVKAELERTVTEIVGRRIQQSHIHIDPSTGNAILMLVMEESRSPRARNRRTYNPGEEHAART